MIPGDAQSINSQSEGRDMDLQSEEQELLRWDKRPAPCAQEVHQVALIEEDKHVRTNPMGLLGGFASAAPSIHPTQPLNMDFVPRSEWQQVLLAEDRPGAPTLLMNSITM